MDVKATLYNTSSTKLTRGAFGPLLKGVKHMDKATMAIITLFQLRDDAQSARAYCTTPDEFGDFILSTIDAMIQDLAQ